jgi:hypothetical protein
VAQSGAGYVIWTLGQNSGHFCSPNATYDAIRNTSIEMFAPRFGRRNRDALAAYNIKTIAYLPSGAPQFDTQAVAALRWRVDDNDTRQAVFQTHWQNHSRVEYSLGR